MTVDALLTQGPTPSLTPPSRVLAGDYKEVNVMKVNSCRYCAKEFTVSRQWQQYCSDRCRAQYWLESNPRQKREAELGACYYCGATANSIDHVPPTSARTRLVDLGLQYKYPFKEVNACRECNSALGARGIWTLAARKRYIKRYLLRKYKKYLRVPNWGERELKATGQTLREYTLSSIIIRDIIRNRIAW